MHGNMHDYSPGVMPAMRDDEEDNPKKPRPIWSAKKRSNPGEASEAIPIRKDDQRDRHRHVV